MNRLTILAVAATATALTLAGLGAAGASTLDHRPTDVLIGGSTGLNSPAGITEDSTGSLYVANTNASSVTIYRHNALGNQTATRTIAGADTGLEYPFDVAVDKHGYLYVSNVGTGTGVIDGILVFAPGANGDATPVRTITGSATTLMSPEGIELESNGTIVVADNGAEAVDVFRQSDDGDVAPVRQLNGPLTGLTDPYTATVAGGLLYVGDYQAITVYSATANGNTTPLRTITRSTTPFDDVTGLAVDSSGNLYATSLADSSVSVFAPGAHGSVAPKILLGGSQTQLYDAWGLELRADRSLLVASFGSNAVNTYGALVPFTRPGKVTSLKVAGKATGKSRKITWKAPADTGGKPITSYKVTVRKGSRTVVSKKVTKRSYTLKTKGLKKGTYKVKVAAVTAVGTGATVTKSLKVRK